MNVTTQSNMHICTAGLGSLFFLAILCTMASASDAELALDKNGWTDLTALLVTSDGTHRANSVNGEKRDDGSMLVYFNAQKGDNSTGQVYWWDGRRIVDSSGRATGAAGQAYGTNPLEPNEGAISAFKFVFEDVRFKATGYADWFLFRRGQTHDTFEIGLTGGRSKQAPMVVAAYGPTADGRAITSVREFVPFGDHAGSNSVVQFHQLLAGLEVRSDFAGATMSHWGMHAGCTSPGEPGVPTWHIEDCKMVRVQMNYLPIDSIVRRSISAFNFEARSHTCPKQGVGLFGKGAPGRVGLATQNQPTYSHQGALLHETVNQPLRSSAGPD